MPQYAEHHLEGSIGKRPSASVRRTCNVWICWAQPDTAPRWPRDCDVTELVILADRDDMAHPCGIDSGPDSLVGISRNWISPPMSSAGSWRAQR